MLVSMTAFWPIIQELIDITRPVSLVEIGADQGECTQKLCAWASINEARVHVIETQPTDAVKHIMKQYPFARIYEGPSLEILPTLEKAGCFMIDGDHNYYTVYHELKLITQDNKPDLILLHDVGWPWGHRDMYYDRNRIPQEYLQDSVTDPDLGVLPGNQGVVSQKGLRSKGQFTFAKVEGGPGNGVLTAVQDFLGENSDYQLFTVDCVFGLGILTPKSAPYYSQIAAVLNRYVANPLIALLEEDRLRTFMNSLDRGTLPMNGMKPKNISINAPRERSWFNQNLRGFLKRMPGAQRLVQGFRKQIQHTHQPLISIVIVVHNMQRAALRTLHSFTASYQGISPDVYEVIVVENGSDQPLSRQQVEAFGPNFRYFILHDPSPSPVGALNFGVKQSKGRMVALMIDGAHIVTPGVLKYALRALKAYKNPVVSILPLHIGPQMQRLSIREGYSEQVEDSLLQQINWPKKGYKLFTISSLIGSFAGGWFLPLGESNCIFLLRRTYDEIGGFDERFDVPGGGFANLDFYYRLCEHSTTDLVVLLGEGSFHQIHGGVSTNSADEEIFQNNLARWKEQYKAIRGKDWKPSSRKPECWGQIVPEAVPFLWHFAERMMENANKNRIR